MVPIPARRHRAPTVYEDDDEEETPNGSPSYLQNGNKRQRLSTASAASEDNEDTLILPDGYDETNARPNLTQWNVDDAVALDLGRPEDRKATLWQRIDVKHKAVRDNFPADNAIVEQIECRNFMCHSHLTVSLGPLINFIIGHNGSGKSAVLTALTLCLGAKATATNRGQSLKNFIKEGEESANVLVTIKNQGASAYQPHIYGDSIVIERWFDMKGTSGFKIRDAHHHVKSTKRQELENIADAFQLQMDNPMNVLSQDMARQFLNSSTASDKYKFFQEGTQIAHLNRDYLLFAQLIEEIDAKLEVCGDDVKELRENFEEARRKKNLADQHEEMRAKKDNFTRMYTWSQVRDQEKNLETVTERISTCDAEIEQKNQQADAAAREFDQANESLEEAQRLVREQQESAAPFQEEKESVESELSTNRNEMLTANAQQRDIKGHMQNDKKNVSNLKRQIEEEQQRQADAVGGEHARRLEEIQEAKTRAEEAQRAYDEAKGNFGPFERDRNEAEQRYNTQRVVVQKKREEVNQQKDRINRLRSNQGKWMSAFPRELPQLLQAIERNKNKFRDTPVGPIGREIKLLKPKWSPILERSYGKSLAGFAVTNKRDESTLRELMKSARYDAPVIICPAAPIDVSNNEPAPDVDTWLRVLEFNHDIIRNLSIITNGAEQAVLIEDQREAFEYAYGNESGRPCNVKQVFCFARGSHEDGRRLGWTSAGARSEAPISGWTDGARMQTAVESQINAANETLQRLKDELAGLEAEFRRRQEADTKAKQSLERHKRNTRNLQVESQKAQEDWEKMQDALEAEQPQDGRLEELERQLKEAEEITEAHIQLFEDAKAEVRRMQGKERALNERIGEIQAKINQIGVQVRKAESRVEKLEDGRHRALQRKNVALAEVHELRQEREGFETQRREQEQTAREFTEQANAVCARVAVPEDETSKSLEEKAKKLIQDLQEQERALGGSAQELRQALYEAKAAYARARVGQKKLQKTNLMLKDSLMKRRGRLTKFRILIADRASVTFTYMLSARKFRGSLMIDTTNKELSISVEPDITKRDASGRQTKTLSGGEKSFSTVCLLLSLWDAMGAPTRCLDEFDVFMDNVNREMSMKMIIESCRGSPSKQFLFITPQAMSNVSLGTDVKIIKMSDPERGQTTLN
ncbi:putative DNA repair protein Rad18 [Phyllosticta citrichinensis]|uniref:DNA repair protein Rad18 n=1 Tax=Phyllosticta citrichinensis TaxID=1130410 RepID=A0ABR1XSQ2_9PEZI